MKLTLVATCLFGLEKMLGEEIDALGCKRIETMDGRITFEGDEKALAAANIRLRCAERVYIRMGNFKAESFEELFEGVKCLPWETFIGKDDAFPVTGHAIHSKLFSIPDCQKIIKKAIVDRLAQKYKLKWMPETGIKYRVEFFIFKDHATLMIDSSGTPLHKRGYRTEAGEAPIRETLAAAMAMISRPRNDVLFWDPFCGSGTIVIEAAMIATRRAPGLNRSFAAEEFPMFPKEIWENERNKAREEIIYDTEFEAYGSDIDTDVLKIAKENAKRAGVDKYVSFFVKDALKLQKPDRKGTIVCNPPYGERLMTLKEVEKLYKDMGRVFVTLEPWQIYVLTSAENFETLYGRRADKVRKLYNGMIPCRFYQFFRPRSLNDRKKTQA